MALQDLTPQLRTRLSRMERAVGWFVFMAALLLAGGFAYYLYQTAVDKGWGVIKAPFHTYVQSAAGLKAGDPVTMMGFPVGTITLVKPQPAESHFNVRVNFDVRAPYIDYIKQRGSYLLVNGGFLPSQRTFEITRGTNGYAWCVTHPIYNKTLDEARHLAAESPAGWQLAEDFFDENSNVVLHAYDPLTSSNLEIVAQSCVVYPNGLKHIADLTPPSNSIAIFDTNVNRNRIVGSWHEFTHQYSAFTPDKESAYLPVLEPIGVGDRLGQVVAEVQQALPNFLALTNQLTRILNNTADTTSNLNATIVSVRPAMTNLVAITSLLKEPGGIGELALGQNGPGRIVTVLTNISTTLTNVNALLVNTDTNLNNTFAGVLETLDHVADITSNLDSQVGANGNMLTGIDKTIRDSDDFIQGLKRHWLLRSAFKQKPVPATNNMAAPTDGRKK